MALYSDYPAARARQIIADVFGVVSVVVIISVALAVTAAIRGLASFGRDLEQAGAGFEQGLSDAADTLGDVPLIGGGIRGPFDVVAGAGAAVAQAGRGQQILVEQLAVSLGWASALVPLVIVVLVWVLPRWRFARRSSQVRRMLAAGLTTDTLAARALAREPLARLTAVHPDPGAAWRANDPVVVRDLALLELRRAGVSPSALK